MIRTHRLWILVTWTLLAPSSLAQIPVLDKDKPIPVFPAPAAPPLLPPPATAVPYPAPPEAELTIPTLPAALPPQSGRSDYLLGGGDRLTIDIFEVPQYGGVYQVPVDGVLYLPLIGGVNVAGLTLGQATDEIANRYSEFLKKPLVTIRLLNTRPPNVFVSGEVKSPGSFTIDLIGGQGDNPGVQLPTLSAALKAAGGVTLSADISQIQIYRRQSQQGGDTQLTVDLRDLIQTGDRTVDLTLRDGDTIFVPVAPEADLRQIRQLALLDFAADINTGRTVSVVGEVRRPGSYNIIGTALADGGAVGLTGGLPTVTNALQQAGGITPEADIRNIQLRRLTQAGIEQQFTLDLWALLQAGDIAQDTVLQEGDTLIVPEADFVSTAELNELAAAQFAPDDMLVSVVGEVANPGRFAVPTNTSLNQAIMVAGGFNRDRAYRDIVQLIRLNPDGSVDSRPVPVDLSQGINEDSNPLLRANDIVVVRRNRSTQVADAFETFFQAGPGALAAFSIPARIFGILETLGIVDFTGNNDE